MPQRSITEYDKKDSFCKLLEPNSSLCWHFVIIFAAITLRWMMDVDNRCVSFTNRQKCLISEWIRKKVRLPRAGRSCRMKFWWSSYKNTCTKDAKGRCMGSLFDQTTVVIKIIFNGWVIVILLLSFCYLSFRFVDFCTVKLFAKRCLQFHSGPNYVTR